MKRERKIGTRGDDHEDVNMGMKKKGISKWFEHFGMPHREIIYAAF